MMPDAIHEGQDLPASIDPRQNGRLNVVLVRADVRLFYARCCH